MCCNDDFGFRLERKKLCVALMTFTATPNVVNAHKYNCVLGLRTFLGSLLWQGYDTLVGRGETNSLVGKSNR